MACYIDPYLGLMAIGYGENCFYLTFCRHLCVWHLQEWSLRLPERQIVHLTAGETTKDGPHRWW